MKKLIVAGAVSLIIGVGSVTVGQAHEGSKSATCPNAGTPVKHTKCEKQGHRHICQLGTAEGWTKQDGCEL